MKSTSEIQEKSRKVTEEENITSEIKSADTGSKKDYGEIYTLSKICEFFINKKMPKGFKLEAEDNLNKAPILRGRPYLNKKTKRAKTGSLNTSNFLSNSEKNDENSTVSKPKRQRKRHSNLDSILIQGYESKLRREHKPKVIEDLGYIDKDIVKGKSNPLRRAVAKVCERGMLKIKKIPYFAFFYNASKSDKLSLSKIDKNIRDYKYQNSYEFIMDLRKLWNECLETYNEQPIIENKVFEMCKITEEIYKELESYNIEQKELEEMNKKVDYLEKRLREIRGNQATLGPGLIFKKTNSEKVLSSAEKIELKNNLRFLTIDQKRGLVDILKDSVDTSKNKNTLEFDIGKLSNKKLRELDKYVKECIKLNEIKKNGEDVLKLKQDLKENSGSQNAGFNSGIEEPNETIEEESSLQSDSSSLSEE